MKISVILLIVVIIASQSAAQDSLQLVIQPTMTTLPAGVFHAHVNLPTSATPFDIVAFQLYMTISSSDYRFTGINRTETLLEQWNRINVYFNADSTQMVINGYLVEGILEGSGLFLKLEGYGCGEQTEIRFLQDYFYTAQDQRIPTQSRAGILGSYDVDCNGILNVEDVRLVIGQWRDYDPLLDHNQNGRVDIADIQRVVTRYYQPD